MAYAGLLYGMYLRMWKRFASSSWGYVLTLLRTEVPGSRQYILHSNTYNYDLCTLIMTTVGNSIEDYVLGVTRTTLPLPLECASDIHNERRPCR